MRNNHHLTGPDRGPFGLKKKYPETVFRYLRGIKSPRAPKEFNSLQDAIEKLCGFVVGKEGDIQYNRNEFTITKEGRDNIFKRACKQTKNGKWVGTLDPLLIYIAYVIGTTQRPEYEDEMKMQSQI